MSEKKEKIVLDVAYQPQVRTGMDTRRIMINVMLALLPSLAMATWEFGMKPVLMVAVSMLSAVFYEWAYRKLLKKPETIGDCSALLTGMLLAMTLPASSPWWLPLIGNFFAIIVVKQLYGGLALEREALYGDYLAHQIARLRRRAEGLRQSGSGEADGFAALADALEAKKGKWEHDNGT